MEPGLIVGIVALVVIFIGIGIKSVLHESNVNKFDVNAEDKTSVKIDGDHYVLYFDATEFPKVDYDGDDLVQWSWELYVDNRKHVKENETLAKLIINEDRSFCTPSTGTKKYKRKQIKKIEIKSPYEGDIVGSNRYRLVNEVFPVCELYPRKIDEEIEKKKHNIEEKYGYNEQYYNDIVESSTNLVEFIKSMKANVSVTEKLNNKFKWPQSNAKIVQIDQMLMIDAIRCYEGLAKSIALDKKESIGLHVIGSLIIKNYNIT